VSPLPYRIAPEMGQLGAACTNGPTETQSRLMRVTLAVSPWRIARAAQALAIAITIALAGCGPFKSEVALIRIDAKGDTIPDYPKIAADMIVNYDPGATVQSFESKVDYSGKIGVELLGHSSLTFPKKSYALELRDSLNRPLEAPLLGLPPGSGWVLHGPYSDKTLMRNFLAYDFARRLRVYGPRTHFAELFVRQGAWGMSYVGVYLLVESIVHGKNHVDVAALEPGDTLAPAITGGYILQVDRVGHDDDYFTMAGDSAMGHPDTVIFWYPPHPAPPQKQWLIGYFDSLAAALPPAHSLEDRDGYARYIDVDSFVDFLLVQELFKNVDAYRLSSYMHKDRLGKLGMGPVWDFDLTTGNARYNDGCDTDGWMVQTLSTRGNRANPPPFWWRRLLQDRRFVERIAARWAELRAGPLTTENVRGTIRDAAHLLREAQKRNFTRWPTLGKRLWPNCPVPGSNPPTYYKTYEAEINGLTTWMDGRLAWMDAHIAAIGP